MLATDVKPRVYGFAFEVGAKNAHFARPDTGFDSTSYPVPTESAARGIIDAILRIPGVQANVDAIALVNPPRYMRYDFNSFAVCRKDDNCKKGNAVQNRWNVLYDCRFQIYGHFRCDFIDGKNNRAHAAQDQLMRLVKQGRFKQRPCMGISDFPIEYIGLATSDVSPHNELIPSYSCVRYNEDGKPYFHTSQNVMIENGLLNLHSNSYATVKNNQVVFQFDDSVPFTYRIHRWARK